MKKSTKNNLFVFPSPKPAPITVPDTDIPAFFKGTFDIIQEANPAMNLELFLAFVFAMRNKSVTSQVQQMIDGYKILGVPAEEHIASAINDYTACVLSSMLETAV